MFDCIKAIGAAPIDSIPFYLSFKTNVKIKKYNIFFILIK